MISGVAGVFGSFADVAPMCLTEPVMVLPRFFLALPVVALFGPSLANLVLSALPSWEFTVRLRETSGLGWVV
ncbi:hypothetical protein BH24DEI2_BH24DEI2_04740 [soil metagenome]